LVVVIGAASRVRDALLLFPQRCTSAAVASSLLEATFAVECPARPVAPQPLPASATTMSPLLAPVRAVHLETAQYSLSVASSD
jgi:hypothetical protein